jgi:hypothetical protein
MRRSVGGRSLAAAPILGTAVDGEQKAGDDQDDAGGGRGQPAVLEEPVTRSPIHVLRT